MFEWNSFLNQSRKKDKYKFIGKETIEGKKYIKFSLEDSTNKQIYYVDVENKVVSKIEYYGEAELYQTNYYTYSYNTVKDEDIAKFDIKNYEEYEVEYMQEGVIFK